VTPAETLTVESQMVHARTICLSVALLLMMDQLLFSILQLKMRNVSLLTQKTQVSQMLSTLYALLSVPVDKSKLNSNVFALKVKNWSTDNVSLSVSLVKLGMNLVSVNVQLTKRYSTANVLMFA
jgi:hypothetical protein